MGAVKKRATKQEDTLWKKSGRPALRENEYIISVFIGLKFFPQNVFW
jgi:hypothetical protein